jgi:hypothetical protein
MQSMKRSIRPFSAFALVALTAGLLSLPQPAGALTSNWVLQDANGNWSDEANWDNGIPMNPGDVAVITNNAALTAARTISINTNVSLKALKFAIPNTAGSGYTVQLGAGGSFTMDSGDGSHSVIQQLRGSARCKITASTILSNDVDVINAVGAATYFDVSNPLSGTYNLHINTDGSMGQPYYNVDNTATFFGDINLHYGTLMISGNDTLFGSLTNGIRHLVFENNAIFRNNGSLNVLGTNRQMVVSTGGGSYNLHNRKLTLATADQLTGSETFTLMTDTVGANNICTIGAADNTFTGTMLLNANVALKLDTNGSISNCPLISLSTSTSLFDVTAKSSGYSIPSNQVVAGIGTVTGSVNVANASATLHPGSYALPGPVRSPGILTIASGDLAFSNGGVYAWELKQLKDNAFPPGITTYSTLNVPDGGASLDGGTLAITFLNGIAEPDSADPFWQAEHVWTVLTAASPPTGKLTVTDGIYSRWAFTTRVNGNTLELVYGPYTKGTLISVQ